MACPLHILCFSFIIKPTRHGTGNNCYTDIPWQNISQDPIQTTSADPESKGENIMAQNVLVVVAGHQITEEELQAFIGHLPKEQQAYASNPQFKEHCKEQLITFHALAKCGEDEKLDETEEYKKGMENARQDILVQMVLKETIESVSVSDEEVKDYYEQNKAQFVKGATVNAKHILTDSEEKCAAILESIVNGEKTFEEAAKESSTCPSGAQGGDLGEFGKGQMVKEFEDAAFQAEPGHVVGPVKTQFGYHLIKVEKKNEAKEAGFAEVKDPIRAELLKRKQDQAYLAKVKELKEKYVQK